MKHFNLIEDDNIKTVMFFENEAIINLLWYKGDFLNNENYKAIRQYYHVLNNQMVES